VTLPGLPAIDVSGLTGSTGMPLGLGAPRAGRTRDRREPVPRQARFAPSVPTRCSETHHLRWRQVLLPANRKAESVSPAPDKKCSGRSLRTERVQRRVLPMLGDDRAFSLRLLTTIPPDEPDQPPFVTQPSDDRVVATFGHFGANWPSNSAHERPTGTNPVRASPASMTARSCKVMTLVNLGRSIVSRPMAGGGDGRKVVAPYRHLHDRSLQARQASPARPRRRTRPHRPCRLWKPSDERELSRDGDDQ
jgi:hypothetical protein